MIFEKKDLPLPSLSIFEAFNLKADYLRRVLEEVHLPDETAVYLDSRI